ncbi:MAG: HD domain-containing protein [Clostridia bacterium]
MDARKLLDILSVAERLKDATRHCYTSGGRRESVAEHCWRTALMAYFVHDEFPEIDLEKLLKLCLIHDLGEAFTGDIPTFQKTQADRAREHDLLQDWLRSLPEPFESEMKALFGELEALQTPEAKICKALDNLEALIQHNESDLKTWLPLEYDLQMTYGNDTTAFSDYLTHLRDEVRADSRRKIKQGT